MVARMVLVFRLLLPCLIVANSVDAASTTTKICPGDDIDIRCASGQMLVMRRAFYGPVGSDQPCGPVLLDPQYCVHPDPLGSLARSCFRKDRCLVPSKDKPELFNYLDPCRGFERFLEVEYECIKDANIKSICDSPSSPNDSDTHGYVTSANYPDHYFNGQSCRMNLRGQEGQYLEITMLDIELEYSPTTNQCYDFVVFHQRKSHGKDKTICKPLGFIDDDLEYPLLDQNTVQISFESSGEHPHRGFLFEYKVTGCPASDIPSSPENGLVRLYQMSFFVLYGCHDGYRLESQTTGFLMCRNAKWVGDPGVCVESDEPPQPLPPLPTSIRPRKPTKAPPTNVPIRTEPSGVVTSNRVTSAAAATETIQSMSSSTIKTSTLRYLPFTRPSARLTTPKYTTPRPKVPETAPTGPNWAMQPIADQTTSTATNGEVTTTTPLTTTLAAVVEAAEESLGVPVIGAIAGGLTLALLLGIFLTAIIVYRKYKKTKLERTTGLSSLRPSAHACVSIPNTYAGVGYAAAKSASLSSSNTGRPASVFVASSSSHTKSGRRRSGNSDLSYESEIYERIAESLKGSNDPILTTSSNSFDCVDVSPAGLARSSFTNPLAVAHGGTFPETSTSTAQKDLMDSDLIYQALKPSLETINEEVEGASSHSVLKEPLPPDDESSLGDSESSHGGQASHSVSEQGGEQGSIHSTDSDPKPRVSKRRLRTRPISMGEADQPETKRRIDKVEYPLFKDDTTGNLENFLDHRRVSV